MFSPRTPRLSVKVVDTPQGKQGAAEWSIPASPFPGGRVCLNSAGLPSSRDTARLSGKLTMLQEAINNNELVTGSSNTSTGALSVTPPCSVNDALASVRQEMLQQCARDDQQQVVAQVLDLLQMALQAAAQLAQAAVNPGSPRTKICIAQAARLQEAQKAQQAAEATAQQAQAQSNAAAAAAAAAEGEAASLRVAMSALRAQHSAKILQLSELEAELRQQASQQGQLLSEGQAAHSKDIADLVRALDVSRQEAAELHSRALTAEQALQHAEQNHKQVPASDGQPGPTPSPRASAGLDAVTSLAAKQQQQQQQKQAKVKRAFQAPSKDADASSATAVEGATAKLLPDASETPNSFGSRVATEQAQAAAAPPVSIIADAASKEPPSLSVSSGQPGHHPIANKGQNQALGQQLVAHAAQATLPDADRVQPAVQDSPGLAAPSLLQDGRVHPLPVTDTAPASSETSAPVATEPGPSLVRGTAGSSVPAPTAAPKAMVNAGTALAPAPTGAMPAAEELKELKAGMLPSSQAVTTQLGPQVLQTPKAAGLWGNSSFGNLLSKTFTELLGPEEAAEGRLPARRPQVAGAIQQQQQQQQSQILVAGRSSQPSAGLRPPMLQQPRQAPGPAGGKGVAAAIRRLESQSPRC